MISILFVLSLIINPKPNMLFFTGGNSLMPELIYSNFIEKMSEDFDVKYISNDISLYKKSNLFEKLLENNILDAGTVAVSHSSGATTLINHCKKFKINKCILLDPVDNNQIFNNDATTTDGMDNVLIIKAEKSYKWSMSNTNKNILSIPKIKIPFIPVGRLNENMFDNKTSIVIKEFGHCDILDQPYSNMMHESFAEGIEDRKLTNIYKSITCQLIKSYINDNLSADTISEIFNNTGIDFFIE